ncbi:MAG: CapA family protein [Patescibacteria group bacterium]|jgi:poly-gamma-glutamate synthesis protein (capsule biosynthesis protein)
MKKFKIEIILAILILILVVVIGLLFVAIRSAKTSTYQTGQIKEVMAQSLPATFAVVEEPIAVEPKETIMAFGGDVMLSRVVGQKMVKKNDFAWPFEKIGNEFKKVDLAIVNLESPFTISSGSHLVQTGSFSFNADPKSMAGLEEAGIDLISLANNHFGNQGQKGMLDTFKTLNDNGIGYVGAGKNDREAHAPYIKEINGVKFGFLSYAYPEDLYLATSVKAGMANMNLGKAKSDIDSLKKQADVIIVLVHAGTEYVAKANSQQIAFDHGVIDAGADLVIGHHPHWVQNIENYKGKYIIYSLGNLIFDQMWSQETREGAIAKVYFQDKELEKIEILPIVINDYGQPDLAIGSQKSKILKRMGLSSGEIKL